MERKVYDYNAVKLWRLVLFPCFWAVIWVMALVSHGGIARLYHGTDPTLISLLTDASYVLALLGGVAAIWSSWTHLKLHAEQITIENGILTYVDRQGRQITCPMSGVMGINLTDSDLLDGSRRSSGYHPQMYKVVTTAGAFRFYPWIRKCTDLCDELNNAAAQHSAMYPNAVSEGTDIDLCPKPAWES